MSGAGASRSRFVIGVDLGTTNTAVAAVDTRAGKATDTGGVEPREVLQLVAAGAVEARSQLPSFVYLPGENDLAGAAIALPWAPGATRVVGELARSLGARQPGQMIASSKSWLCHGGVDRRVAILPWGVEGGTKLSPVDASSLLLQHVAAAWDHAHAGAADARFAEQEIVLTVPASFDEAARELTLEAAKKAGLPAVVLLEEPQAAFYAWMHAALDASAGGLRAGEHVLVFDVGGGTTDFTLIEVKEAGRFERTAVGDHLLLGGDNIDLALAKLCEQRIAARPGGRKLDALEWHGLVHACRLAKESLLGDAARDAVPIVVAGRGTRLIGGTLREELTRADLDEILLGGFFPVVERGDLPRRTRGRSALQEFGLPYASDPAITRHLAAFLAKHGAPRVDAVLFNGGAMTPTALRQRVLEQIGRWQPDAGAPRELVRQRPELAVAEGAAYYGLVRRGVGARIEGGAARAFYVGVGKVGGRESVVCIAPRGLGEGQSVELARDFHLITNRPVSFRLLSSTTREDRAGEVVALPEDTGGVGDDFVELPPIVSALRAPGRSEVLVHIEVRLTELGALEIWCTEPTAGQGSMATAEALAEAGRWRLAFDMRSGHGRVDVARDPDSAEDAGAPAPGAPAVPSAIAPRIAEAKALVAQLFAGPPDGVIRLMKQLEEVLGARRDEWAGPTTRALFDAAYEVAGQRKRSAEHEARWLHLVGFCLRPGFGEPLDDWRARSLWLVFIENLWNQNAEQCRLAWWITWRRIAGGLTRGQQQQIYLRAGQHFLTGGEFRKRWLDFKPSREEAAEMVRCLANLERLPAATRASLGDEFLKRLDSKKARAEGLYPWALARLGARVPLYGPLDAVVPATTASAWLRALMAQTWPDPARISFCVAQIARRAGDRVRDIDDDQRAEVIAWLRAAGAEREVTMVSEVVELEAREQQIAFGDTLPPGLRLTLQEDAGPGEDADGG